ncbi:hypothetical protein FRB90_011861 [Tulasnella sp. 427]|nr:hypothetical protein FRB90_011861 [Tulasnella sp. 427]
MSSIVGPSFSSSVPPSAEPLVSLHIGPILKPQSPDDLLVYHDLAAFETSILRFTQTNDDSAMEKLEQWWMSLESRMDTLDKQNKLSVETKNLLGYVLDSVEAMLESFLENDENNRAVSAGLAAVIQSICKEAAREVQAAEAKKKKKTKPPTASELLAKKAKAPLPVSQIPINVIQPGRKRRVDPGIPGQESLKFRPCRDFFFEHISDPYPTPAQKQDIVTRSGIPINSVNQWFTNTRRRSGWMDIMKGYANNRKDETKRLIEGVLHTPHFPVPKEVSDAVWKMYKHVDELAREVISDQFLKDLKELVEMSEEDVIEWNLAQREKRRHAARTRRRRVRVGTVAAEPSTARTGEKRKREAEGHPGPSKVPRTSTCPTVPRPLAPAPSTRPIVVQPRNPATTAAAGHPRKPATKANAGQPRKSATKVIAVQSRNPKTQAISVPPRIPPRNSRPPTILPRHPTSATPSISGSMSLGTITEEDLHVPPRDLSRRRLGVPDLSAPPPPAGIPLSATSTLVGSEFCDPKATVYRQPPSSSNGRLQPGSEIQPSSVPDAQIEISLQPGEIPFTFQESLASGDLPPHNGQSWPAGTQGSVGEVQEAAHCGMQEDIDSEMQETGNPTSLQGAVHSASFVSNIPSLESHVSAIWNEVLDPSSFSLHLPTLMPTNTMGEVYQDIAANMVQTGEFYHDVVIPVSSLPQVALAQSYMLPTPRDQPMNPYAALQPGTTPSQYPQYHNTAPVYAHQGFPPQFRPAQLTPTAFPPSVLGVPSAGYDPTLPYPTKQQDFTQTSNPSPHIVYPDPSGSVSIPHAQEWTIPQAPYYAA